MLSLLQDIRYGCRILLKAPGFTALVVLSLALGIGANTAVFSAINAVMLRMLPVRDPQKLVMLQWTADPKSDMAQAYVDDIEGSYLHDDNGNLDFSYSFSYPAYEKFKTENHVFTDTFAFAANDEKVNVGLEGRAESAHLQGISGNYFFGVGVPAAMGRTILPSDDSVSASPVTVVSSDFFRRKLGGDPSAIGKAIVINGTPVMVVGVAPPKFFGLEPGASPDLWVPLHFYAARWAEENGEGDQEQLKPLSDEKRWWVGVVGRLKPGVSAAAAQAEVAVIFTQSLSYAGTAAQASALPPEKRLGLEAVSLKGGLDNLRRQFSTSLRLLMAMVGLVLFIACANVAGLLLARSSARMREMGVRFSLGAPRSRIIRQVLTESLLLSVLGGVAGCLVAVWASSALLSLFSGGRNPIYLLLPIDGRVLTFTVLISFISGMIFGFAPALKASQANPLTVLKQTSSTISRGSKKFLSGKILVGGQVALSLCLLIAAGLFLRTLLRLQRVPLGFDSNNLVVFTVQPGLNGYRGPDLQNYYEGLRRKIEAIPGVQSVSFSQRGPVGEGSGISTVSIPGYTTSSKHVYAWRHDVAPGYFDTLGIPLTLGRAIGPQDTQSSTKVVVINQTMARKYFAGQDPIGRVIRMGEAKDLIEFQIIGVAGDVKYAEIRQDVPPTAYFSYLQRQKILNFETFQVRTLRNPDGVMEAIRNAAIAQDRFVPVINLATESEMVDRVLFLERAFATLSIAFALLALVLATVGLYGTIAYTVAQRTHEIGIRLAIGAERGNILQLVLRETMAIVICGLVVGFPLAYVSARLVKEQIFQLSPQDPLTILISTITIVAAAVAAGFVPAWRASRVDPMIALRYE